MALEYTNVQVESARTNLEVFAKQVRAYIMDHGEWMECVQPLPSLLCLYGCLKQCLHPEGYGVPVTQSIAYLLTVIVEHKGDLKGLSINKVLWMWLSHFQQFGSYVKK